MNASRRVALLLSLPLLGGICEILDVRAARLMSGFSVSLVYRALALLGILPMWWIAGRPAIPARGVAIVSACAVVGLIQAPIYFRALQVSTPSVVATASACVPVVVMILAALFAGERIAPARAAFAVGAVACLLGMIWAEG